jgi:hypothetical protein
MVSYRNVLHLLRSLAIIHKHTYTGRETSEKISVLTAQEAGIRVPTFYYEYYPQKGLYLSPRFIRPAKCVSTTEHPNQISILYDLSSV